MQTSETITYVKKRSAFKMFMKSIFKNKLATIGLAVIILLLLVAAFAPLIAPYSYITQDLNNAFAPPSWEHLLGTDNLGRDELSRLIYGTRQSLQIGLLSVALGAALGTTFGLFAGYYGGLVDELLMRFLDIYQSIPGILLSIVLAVTLGPGLNNAIIALGIGTMPVYARIIRAPLLQIRNMEYIEAARAINARDFRIIMKYGLPNAVAPLIVQITMSIGMSILSASMLSFIGLGAQPPVAEWGAMLTEGQSFIRQHGFLITYPGIAIIISVLAFNLFGDGLRDALDPRLNS
jgi:peptide/nickel transport system permease protein